MECIVVTEVPPRFYEELICKGTNTQRKAPELDIGCVTVLCGWWDDVGWEWCYLFLIGQPCLCLLPRCKSQAEWTGVSSWRRRSTSPVVFLLIHHSTEAVAGWRWFQSGCRKTGKNKTVFYRCWNTVETIFQFSSLSLPTVDLMITGGTSIWQKCVYIFSSSFHERLSSAKCS